MDPPKIVPPGPIEIALSATLAAWASLVPRPHPPLREEGAVWARDYTMHAWIWACACSRARPYTTCTVPEWYCTTRSI